MVGMNTHQPLQLVVKEPEPGTFVWTLMETDAGGQPVKVKYTGILPDLFREGQGVVTEGKFEASSHEFIADTVLAKHDEKYMPKEVADRLKSQGLWKEGEGAQ